LLKKIIFYVRYFLFIKLNKSITSEGLVILHNGVKIITEKNSSIYFGKSVVLKENTIVYAKSNCSIKFGSRTSTGRNTEISVSNKVNVGSDVIMGANTYITDSNHGYAQEGILIKNQPMDIGETFIGNNVWLGRSSMLLKDSYLGDNSIVAANAVVARAFVGNSVLGGVPAKLIRRLYE